MSLTAEQDVIGSIILWNLDSVTHLVSSAHPDSRTIAFDIAVPQTASGLHTSYVISHSRLAVLAILLGSILFEYNAGSHVAMILTGIWGLWYIGLGFALKYEISTLREIASRLQCMHLTLGR